MAGARLTPLAGGHCSRDALPLGEDLPHLLLQSLAIPGGQTQDPQKSGASFYGSESTFPIVQGAAAMARR